MSLARKDGNYLKPTSNLGKIGYLRRLFSQTARVMMKLKEVVGIGSLETNLD